MGRDGYAIVGQGRIAEIVGAKSSERREIFEEASGIAKYRYRKNEAERRLAGCGVGAVDAAFNVIATMLDRAPHLERYAVNAITGGTDAQGEATVRLTEGPFSAAGRGSDPDIIIASAKAYVDALNRLAAKEREESRN